jgi:predicted dehydrogenase
MAQPLVIGLGRSGAGLHLRVLARLRSTTPALFDDQPVMACDPRQTPGTRPGGVLVTESISDAARLADPESTVAHVCTPPDTRFAVLAELTDAGIRHIIVEKPLALDAHELDRILRLRARHGLNLVVVGHWLEAELTRRLRSIVQQGQLGPLQSISVAQHKPRYRRSLMDRGHPSAFDVEIPHSLAVLLRIAGPCRVVDAGWKPMRCGNTTLPRMGAARMALHHESGVRSELFSDLTSPVRERRITLYFENGSATGHYPLSESDEYAQLSIVGNQLTHEVFPDDALTTFTLRTYQRFSQSSDSVADQDFTLHGEVVRLLCDAKNHCRARESVDSGDAAVPTAVNHHAK